MHIDNISATLVTFGHVGNGLFQNVTINEMQPAEDNDAITDHLGDFLFEADWLIFDNVYIRV